MNTSETIFNQLVDRHSTDLYRYAYWLTHDQPKAEDIVQEVYLRAWKNIDQLRNQAAAKGWLYTILRREHARQFEKKVVPTQSLEHVLESDLPLLYENHTDNQILYEALEQIPENYREPFMLQVLGGFSCKEIAIILGLSRSNVLTRVFRARQKLRKRLSDNQGKRIIKSS